MHSRIIAFAALCLSFVPFASRATPCLALGDSLTFAYEAEFGFKVTVPLGPTYGDGFGPEVRNWVEILRDPVYRGADFDFGARDEFELDFIFYSYDLLFRHQYNWALPGLRIFELRDFMEGTLTFRDLVEADPDLAQLLEFSDLDLDTAFELTDLENQIRDTAGRLVFFIGGNDVRGAYGDIYQGGAPDAFIAPFIDDAAAILDRVRELNPTLPVVVVNVPHIGITPDIKGSYPTDPIGTGRVTAALRDLNRQLKALADARGYGYADVFTPTLPLLADGSYAIHGIPFLNAGSTTGNLDYIWLNGEYSANFHPNTNGQAIIANEIIDAFNARYGSGIQPLSATEILGGLHGKSATQIDMPFATWMDAHALAGLDPSDDSDGDGIPAGVEFGTGLNPILRDARKVASSVRQTQSGPMLELAYPIRLPTSTRYSLVPAYTADPGSGFIPFGEIPATGTDGLASTAARYREIAEEEFGWTPDASHFRPAHRTAEVRRGDCVLIGDAAGLASRDLGEGIAPAVESGIAAAAEIAGQGAYAPEAIPANSIAFGPVQNFLARRIHG